MMHMFKNLSTVKDYNHSEVDGDARNRMKRHRKLQEDNFEASAATGTTMCRHRRARDAVVQSAAVPGFRPYASVFDPSTERSETITSRSFSSTVQMTLLSHA
jgi:hypothetical protein